jgi:pantothenate kinase type III
MQPIVIATGGLADIFCPYSRYINKIDKDLTLKGLFLIFSKKIRIPLVI